MATVADSAPINRDETTTAGYSWYALILLMIVFALNFLDRTLIYILFVPIKREMAFSDFELGLLGTTSFVIFFTLLGIPFGRLADRYSRKNMIAAGLAVWSLFSGLTGFAGTFWTLFFCRVMVGVGEATLGPAALSLLSDYFPPRRRATIQAIFSAGVPIGSGLAFFLGGWIGLKYGWRLAFYFLGFPGLLFAVLVFLLKEQRRGRTEVAPAQYTSKDWKRLLRARPLRYHYAGYALYAVAANSLGIWGPAFFTRAHGYDIKTLGAILGILSLFGGIPCAILGGLISDRLRAFGPGGRMRLSSITALAAFPFWLLFLFADRGPLLLFANFVLLGLSLLWIGPATADVHDLTGPHLRGLGMGVFVCTINLAAYGIGSPLIGKLNDLLGASTDPGLMRYGFLVSPICCLFASALLWRGSRVFEKMREST